MTQPNPNDTKLEQQRSESAEASLKKTEDNHTTDSEAAADRIADNVKEAKKDK